MYYFRKVLLAAYSELTSQSADLCLKQSGNGPQKEFDTQKKDEMKALYQVLAAIEVPTVGDGQDATPNWAQYQAKIEEATEAAIRIVREKAQKMREPEEHQLIEFAYKDFETYVGNLLAIHKLLSTEFNAPNWKTGQVLFKDQDEEAFTNKNKSPWFNQFIDVYLTYFNKKIVANAKNGNPKPKELTQLQKIQAFKVAIGKWKLQADLHAAHPEQLSQNQVQLTALDAIDTLLKKDESSQKRETSSTGSRILHTMLFFGKKMLGWPVDELEPLVEAFKGRLEAKTEKPVAVVLSQ